jgi:L-alanine-DL-glutamate epimerase-like enolase superfamily enzyme
LLADGIDVMKLWPFDEFSAPPYLGHYLTAEDIDKGLDTIRQIKSVVGERMRVAIDGHGRYQLTTAKMLARALQPYNILWYEDMTLNENAPALRELKEASGSICLAVSERLFTRRQLRDVLERRACDFVIADPSWMGGITEARKLANMAETYEIPFAPHNCGGPVLHLVCTALSAHLPNLWLMETVRSFYDGWFKEVVTDLPDIRAGFSALPEGPGLGARLRPEVWQRDDATIDVTEIGQTRDPEALVYIQSGYGNPWRH